MRPEFELNHLKYFYFTVLEGTVSKAADRLCVQQPVVSKMLGSLEDRFGQKLFRKAGRRKVLTDFGQLVYRHCQSAFKEIEKLDQIRTGAPLIAGPVNFGSCEGIVGDQIAISLKTLCHRYPSVHPNVYTSTATHLVELIGQRKLEFGLFFHLPELPAALEIIKRVPTRFHLVVGAKFKAKQDVIERFIGSREIDDTSTHKFPTVERMRKDYPGTRIALSSNHLGLHKGLVLSGFGCSVLPAFLVAKELKSKKLHDLYPKEKFVFDLKVVARKSDELTPAARELIAAF